jgi:hypothetical protein
MPEGGGAIPEGAAEGAKRGKVHKFVKALRPRFRVSGPPEIGLAPDCSQTADILRQPRLTGGSGAKNWSAAVLSPSFGSSVFFREG